MNTTGRRLSNLAVVWGAAALVAPLLAAPVSAAEGTDPGIRVVDGRVVEPDGSDLVLRGINHAHTWYPQQVGAFADIKATGANAVRVVLSSGDQWTRNGPEDVASVVHTCDVNRLVCALEVHDTTGHGDEYAPAAITLDQAVDYWEELYPTLAGTQDRVLVNIGNEPFGNGDDVVARWAPETAAAVQRLREIGYEHTIVVDAPNWGQDWTRTMATQAQQVFDADPDGNTVFSVHMYEVYADGQVVTDYLERFVDAGLPLIVGEFGPSHYGNDVDEDTILAETRRLGLGWFGWSWSGNSGGVEDLDLVLDFDPRTPSVWGTRLIDGPDGIEETSVEASVFGDRADGCSAELEIQYVWPGGYQGQVRVQVGDAPVSAWSTSWKVPGGSELVQTWHGALEVDRGVATVVSESWNGSVPANGTVDYGFTSRGEAPASPPVVSCAAS
ncbi:cellulase family glycosylhydrolase [Oerskovia flava]|uniref:cellulase family glycosylhydrolase n=1 Tax=Oerskovia flava TaxID=2986422 RepID=UPI00223EB6D4|nr:cellulase family glycosylhydrolase [Oerskovia sp. JB1-3-2]